MEGRGGGAVNFSALHTCLNCDGLQPWRAADLLALNGGAYRLRFHQCRPLIGMPWQLDPAFGSVELAKMFTVPELHKMLFFVLLQLRSVEAEAKNLHEKKRS